MKPGPLAFARRSEGGVNEPRVSVLLASRDGERFLGAALASLAAQTLPGAELLLVDDGSRDGTRRTLEAFAAGRPGARVLHGTGEGPAAARHRAAREARGMFLAVQDDDDVSHPERLAREASFLEAHPDVALVGSAADVIDESGRVTRPYDVPLGARAIARMLRRAPPFVHGSVMMRRAAYAEAGGYRAPFRAAEDYDLYLRLATRGRLANLPERLYGWREHSGNSFARRRSDHLFFLALARAFDWERRQRGADSMAALEGAGGHDVFLAESPLGPRIALYWGEALVREGRVAEARRVLSLARGAEVALAALAWRAISLPVAFTPRARRARAAG